MSWNHLPVMCLSVGLLWGLVFGNPYSSKTSLIGRWSLQLSVVALGFGIDLTILWRTGFQGLWLSLVALGLTLGLGTYAGHRLGLSRNLALLLSIGTGICGGSAIAAAAPVLRASDDDVAASLATVFLLNAVALFLFPEIGRFLSLTPEEFAHWAALGIHDTSSVVGATLAFDAASLPTATTLKLSRALWIVPCCLAFAFLIKNESQPNQSFRGLSVPWFIPGFVFASLCRTAFPQPVMYDALNIAAKVGLSLSLLCIGAGVSRRTLQRAGIKALGLGLFLWLVLGGSSLAWIRFTKLTEH